MLRKSLNRNQVRSPERSAGFSGTATKGVNGSKIGYGNSIGCGSRVNAVENKGDASSP
ncbi:MAG: hypothetical protein BWZ10_01198 [candidate division BRC1 bacterium ADurb.BinA364]|nr:MAG: hypothetical protein BWZ10_01198 [candidate division BRC1 bacterium ADurb.BinA364]